MKESNKNKIIILTNVNTFLKVFIPFLTLLLGAKYSDRIINLHFGFEFFVPFVFAYVSHKIDMCLKKIKAKESKYKFPVPEKRFTIIEDDETVVEKRRLQEMILYVSEVEDWLEDNYII